MNIGESSIAESTGIVGGSLDSPNLGGYGAIRMDPVAMVRHLDSIAIEEARRINPKTYLVYLVMGLGPPVPKMPWHCFEVHIIAPPLRTVDEERRITSNMCIPIFPNERHPIGQGSLRTEPIFPFSNCYHWDDTQVHIRVHTREEGFLMDGAITLPSFGQWRLMLTLAELRRRAATARDARAPPPRPAAAGPEPGAGAGASLSAPSANGGLPPETTVTARGVQERCDILDFSSTDTEDSLEDTVEEAVNPFGPMEVFENPYADVERLPLVHLWIDMPSQVQQEDIGSPVDFFEERDAIVKIIKEARARDPTLPTLAEVVGMSSDPLEIGGKSDSNGMSVLPRTNLHAVELDDDADASAPEPGPAIHWGQKLGCFRPLKMRLRKLVTVPYIPIWP